VKKAQWITAGTGLIAVALLFIFGRTIPEHKAVQPVTQMAGMQQEAVSTDTILYYAKMQVKPEQVIWLNTLENSISRGDVRDQKLKVLHQLAHFWSDTAAIFEPYAWYEAEAARLENSEKSLTFAARLFLDNLQNDDDGARRKWKALQAKDLFERSLTINPADDSAKIGLGACYLFGNISATPMEGILKIREVAAKDSTNCYAQIMLAKGSLISGQYDKAIPRLETVARLQPDNAEAVLMLADIQERLGNKESAISWYERSLQLVKQPDALTEIRKRITALKK
jgi:tetratricopeptide (TPR) repeat protein